MSLILKYDPTTSSHLRTKFPNSLKDIIIIKSLTKNKIMKNDPSVKSGIQNLKLVEPFRLSLYSPPKK